MVALDKEYMKLVVGKVVDHMTQKSCIPTDSMKRGEDDCSSLIHDIMTGTYVDLDKTNPVYLIG